MPPPQLSYKLVLSQNEVSEHEENRGLRLKSGEVTEIAEALHGVAASTHVGDPADPRQGWQYFDERLYIAGNALGAGEDPYMRNKFNQHASDLLPSNRDVPDTRGLA